MQDLAQLFEPVIESMGYELVGVEFSGGSGHGTLRVYIDREQGVSVDDCAAISHQVSGILDVEEPIKQAYFERFADQTAKIRLAAGIDGRRNFKGRLAGVVDSSRIRIHVDGEDFDLPYADIARANLVGEV